MAYLVGTILFVLVAWGFFNPFVGLVALVTVNTLQPGEIWPQLGALHVERVVALSVLVSFVLRGKKVEVPPITKWILWLWLAMFLSVPLAVWRMGALQDSLDFTKIVIYHILIFNLVTTTRRFWWFIVTFVVLVVAVGGQGYYMYLQGVFLPTKGELERAVGMTSNFANPNSLGMTLVYGLPFVFVAAMGGSLRLRLLSLAAAGISVWMIALTGSRVSFFSLIFLVFCLGMSHKHRLVYLALAVPLLVVTWFAMPAEYQERYLTVRDLDTDASYQLRVMSRQAGWEMFKDHPITGVGMGQFGTASGITYWPGGGRLRWYNAHNLYFQVLGELGLVGAVVFALLVLQLLKDTRSLWQSLRTIEGCPRWLRYYPAASMGCILTLLLAGWSSHNLTRSTWFFLGALTAALGGIVSREYLPKEGAVATNDAAVPEGGLTYSAAAFRTPRVSR